MINNVAGRVDYSHFAACTVARVKTHYSMACQRRLQQKLLEISAENMNSLFFGILGKLAADFSF